MISAQNLSKYYDEIKALDNISFEIKQGEGGEKRLPFRDALVEDQVGMLSLVHLIHDRNEDGHENY